MLRYIYIIASGYTLHATRCTLHASGWSFKRVAYSLRRGAFCVVIFLFVLLNQSFGQDKIIAIVNNEVITQKDLNEFTNFMQLQLSKEYEGAELENKVQSIKPDLLDRLIEDRLILQEAKKNKVAIDENRVKAKVNEIRKHYPTDAEFQKDLGKQGLVQADVESKIREQLLMYNIIEEKVRGKIAIRPDEVTSFYHENTKDFILKEERELELVTLENEDLAQSFSYSLKNGEKLEDLATRYPITVSKIKAEQGGELRNDIEEVVFKLGIGEVSGPVKVDEKYYVFKLDNIIPARQCSLAEVQDKIHTFLFEKKMQEGLAKWLQELKDCAYIKTMQ